MGTRSQGLTSSSKGASVRQGQALKCADSVFPLDLALQMG